MVAFGPVPSRRLGRSLGINHIPPKTCSYSCIYCQLGCTNQMRVERQVFYAPEEILRAVRERIAQVRAAGEAPDYLALVPDGEPTLDTNLGRTIAMLRPLGLPIAVISNGSLVGRPDVREDLLAGDWVSLKVDAVTEESWRRINRPHGSLRLSAILEGMLAFAHHFQGELATETMLVAGVNDAEGQVKELAGFLARLRPAVAYLAIPTRPPAEKWVRAPAEEVLNRAYQLLAAKLERVEYLVGYEGNAFACTGNVEEDILSITAVHPMRREAVEEVLARAGTDWTVAQRLIERGQLVETSYSGHRFYLRRLRQSRGRTGVQD
jgi:wyosine [tRNA(Phe)-imidazoG37] synthetase (radical SAM superfamily)